MITLLNIIVGIVELVVLIFLANFLRPYIGEKAKGLATKQDIKDITDKVESVKTFYAKELEAIRSDLSFSTQQRLAIKEKERDILFAFLDDCLITLHEKFSFDVTILVHQENEVIWEYEESVHAQFAKIRMSYNRLLIYFPNESELIKSANEVLEASKLVENFFSEEFYSLVSIGFPALRGLQEYVKLVKESKPSSANQVPDMITNAEEAISKYRAGMKPPLQHFDQQIDNFVDLVRQHVGEELVRPYK